MQAAAADSWRLSSCPTHLAPICTHVQGRLILYGQQYRPRFSNGPPVGLPVLKPAARSRRFYFPYWHEVGACFYQGQLRE